MRLSGQDRIKSNQRILMDSRKVEKFSFPSFQRKLESSKFNTFWMPDQAQHDDFYTFYEIVNIRGERFCNWCAFGKALYKLKSLGYGFEKVFDRVSILFQVGKDYITGRGRQKEQVRAGDLLFYWTVVELGMPMLDLAGRFDITPAAVSYAVQRGEKMAKERGYQLETWFIWIFKDVPLP